MLTTIAFLVAEWVLSTGVGIGRMTSVFVKNNGNTSEEEEYYEDSGDEENYEYESDSDSSEYDGVLTLSQDKPHEETCTRNNNIKRNNTKRGTSLKVFASDKTSLPNMRRQISYETYDETELQKIYIQMKKTIVEQTGLSQSDVEILLQSCKYNVADLLNEYTADADKLFQRAGVLFDKVEVNTEKELELCTICYCDNIAGRETETLGCNHRYCSDCFTNHLKNIISNGFTEVCSATCPHHACNVRIGRDIFQKLLTLKEMETFEKALFKDFTKNVEDGKGVYCPKERCSQFIVGSKRKRNIICAKGHRFCYRCKQKPHTPVTCANALQWEKLSKKAGGEENIDVLMNLSNKEIKPCPNPDCNVATEKISGCMYLTCSSCKCNWCWQCGEWGGKQVNRPLPHHVHQCNQPKNKEWLAGGSYAMMFDVSERFLWYCERKNNHTKSKKIAKNNLDKVKEMLSVDMILGMNPKLTSSEAKNANDIILSALETVVDGRVVLGWSYAFAFFVKDEGPRNLFEHSQKVVEDLVEKLTFQVEKPLKTLLTELNSLEQITHAVSNQVKEFEMYQI